MFRGLHSDNVVEVYASVLPGNIHNSTACSSTCHARLKGSTHDNVVGRCRDHSVQGVVVAFRVVDGVLRKGDTVRLMNTKKEYHVDEIGVRAPTPIPVSPQTRLRQVFKCCRA